MSTEVEILAALLLAIDRGDAAVRWVHRPGCGVIVVTDMPQARWVSGESSDGA